MKRFLRSLGAVAFGALCVVSVAGATVTTPPTVNASDLTPILYSVAAAILAALLLVIGPTWLAKVPFAIVNLVNRAIHKLMGRAKPAAG